MSFRPAGCVGYLFALLPLWWFLGLEQFIGVPALILVLGIGLYSRGSRLRVPAMAGWMLLFIMVQVASLVAVSGLYRLATFSRTLSAYLAALLVIVLVFNWEGTREDVRRVLRAMAFGLAASAIVGVLAETGVFRPDFRSLTAAVVPGGMAATDYGSRIVNRFVGSPAWFIGLDNYYRLNGMFLYATTYGTVLAASMPVGAYLATSAQSRTVKLAWRAWMVLIGVNLAFTTARVAIAATLCGIAYVIWTTMGGRLQSRWRIVGGTAVMLAMLTGGTVLFSRYQAPIREALSLVMTARGGGSVRARTNVYHRTFQGWMERPILGWATERDFLGSAIPAGSHSYYLGVLFRHGSLGLAALLGLLYVAWRALDPRVGGMLGKGGAAAGIAGRGVLIVLAVNGITDVLDLDGMTFLYAWGYLALFARMMELPSRTKGTGHSVGTRWGPGEGTGSAVRSDGLDPGSSGAF